MANAPNFTRMSCQSGLGYYLLAGPQISVCLQFSAPACVRQWGHDGRYPLTPRTEGLREPRVTRWPPLAMAC